MRRDRTALKFQEMASEGRTGLILFLTVGFPDPEATLELVPALVEAGADAIELGVPFSDPLADGPTIQQASFHALRQGVTLRRCLDVVGSLRRVVPDTPLVLMGYYNPILAYGLPRFARDAEEAGVDGVIVADLPAEEAGPLRGELAPRGIHLIPLLAPTSTDERIQRACEGASGFIYCVSLTGVTGAREELPPGIPLLTRRVRSYTPLPLAVGFGISRREHIQAIGNCAQAAVVGSALIKTLQDSPRSKLVPRAKAFVARLAGRTQ
jgi:tryptophan synthase alpha chain